MDEDERYTVVVSLLTNERWRLELHSTAERENQVLGIMDCGAYEGIPEVVRVKMTLIDMGDDVNPRARMVEGVGSRYDTPQGNLFKEGMDVKRHYFLNYFTAGEVVEVGFHRRE